MSKSVNIAGVILRDKNGKYLLVQERQAYVYGLWNWPAGHVEEGESLTTAAIREAKEEVGLDVKIVREQPLYIGEGSKKEHLVHSFFGQVVGGNLSFQKSELLDAKWFSPEEITGLDKDGKTRGPWILSSIRKIEKNENIRY